MTSRYSRQTMLPEFGEEGQKKLSEAKVLIVGIGGLGSPISLYLTGAGVGCIGIVDDDVVSETNLQRQVIYTEKDIDKPKTDCAARRLRELNSSVIINTYNTRFTIENGEEIATDYDIIIDGSDNFATRYIIDEIAFKQNKPYIFGSIGEFHGLVSVFTNGLRYSDLFPKSESPSDKPIIKGVLGPVPGIVGSFQAIEAIKVITNTGNPLINKLLTIDTLTMEINLIEL